MTTPLHEVCRASLPRAALPALAGLRARPGGDITLEGERAWGGWPAGGGGGLRRGLPGSGEEELLLLNVVGQVADLPGRAAGRRPAPHLEAADVEAIPRAAFEPLTRAGLRLALREAGT